jgi:hypothetical protein
MSIEQYSCLSAVVLGRFVAGIELALRNLAPKLRPIRERHLQETTENNVI